MKKIIINFFVILSLVISMAIEFPYSVSAQANISPNVNYKIINSNSGKFLDVYNSSTADGGNVVQWSGNGGTNQLWSFVDMGGGFFKIVNRKSGKVLDVYNNSTADGGNIVQWSDNGGTNQQWKLVDMGGGYYKIVNRKSGKLLDVDKGSTADGGNAIQWTDNGGKNQQWRIESTATGNVTYTLVQAQNPTQAQKDAYAKIKSAMDTAVSYYNSYTSISKKITVYYEPGVPTADGNINGTIRFGSQASMNHITAMHEIAHTVGVGTSSKWTSLVSNGVYTGGNATNQLRAVTGDGNAVLRGDRSHFWPYGLNYTSEVKSNTDLINHCKIVDAMKKDGL